jgi:hypothetical protein
MLGPAVAHHLVHGERHRHPVAEAVADFGREVAQDAAADLPALGLHLDGLGDGDLAARGDADVAVEGRDPLHGLRRDDE